MLTSDSDEMASQLAEWLRKPYLKWFFAGNIGIGLAATIVAIGAQLWWLLFIPLLAFVECSALYFGSSLAKALRAREAEIERLRQRLGTV